ncbi:MAG TPA: hypothetical protein EYG79_08435, partial [Rhodobacteraceae bacterium]|nr:hypothetical protein [Paracoccaceae bacterium]
MPMAESGLYKVGGIRYGLQNNNEHTGSRMASKKHPPKGRAGKATPAPPPLVASRADKVVKKVAPKKAAAKKAKPKKAAKKAPPRKAAKRKAAPKGNIITRPIRWLFRTLFKIIWWFTWRGALLGSFLLALWVGYYYVQLPPLENQLDGRSRGSVRLLDRYGNIFAWRGEQFDGSL